MEVLILPEIFLSPDDNLTRALGCYTRRRKKFMKQLTNLIDGLKMVQKEFSSILEKHGVKKIEALNEKFDHNFHQAMMEIEMMSLKKER